MLTYPSIDPVALNLGSLEIRWYGIAYVSGILLAWLCCTALIKRGYSSILSKDIGDFIPWATIGIVVGGRLGHVLFYGGMYYLDHPLEILMIWKPGMAFHGGLIGVAVATVWFCRARHIKILDLLDLISVATPIGLFFGRLANFINGELWGRLSESSFVMVFPYAGPYPRHPSQLYEAVLEGILLFCIQLFIIILAQKRKWQAGVVAGSFLFFYAVMRTIAEFFREPEDGFVGPFTAGQFLSLPLLIIGFLMMQRGIKVLKKDA